MVLAWAGLAWAGSGNVVGHWFPDDLAPRSEVYVSTAERLQVPFTERNAAVERIAAGLREYREALDLLGARAPAAERARLEELEKAYQREYATLQAFADTVITDYDVAFTSAVERAAAALGEVEQCPSRIRAPGSGPRIPGAQGSVPNPDCHGEDLNDRLADAVDADPVLAAAMKEVLERPWPSVTVPVAAQAPIGGAERWLSARDLLIAGARAPLRAIDARDDDARMAFESALEQGATAEELRRLEPEAKRVEQATAEARAALAAPILAAAEAAMARWKGEPATGWCTNPSVFGGCTGSDASRELVGRLVDDKKVAKTFPEE